MADADDRREMAVTERELGEQIEPDRDVGRRPRTIVGRVDFHPVQLDRLRVDHTRGAREAAGANVDSASDPRGHVVE